MISLNLLLIMTISLTTVPAKASLDLNELPPAEDEFDSDGPPSQTGSKSQGKVSLEQAKKLKAMYAKVLKLFNVLKICDSDSFDLKKIGIPGSFTEQEKAMMLLRKVAKSKFIKKSDLPRYKRIMENCEAISKVYQQSVSDQLSIESQVSGVHLSEAIEMKRALEESPMRSLASRFLSKKSEQGQQALRSEAIHSGARAARTNSMPHSTRRPSPTVVMSLREETPTDRGHVMYNFI